MSVEEGILDVIKKNKLVKLTVVMMYVTNIIQVKLHFHYKICKITNECIVYPQILILGWCQEIWVRITEIYIGQHAQ